MNNTDLKTFAHNTVIEGIGKKLSPRAIDAAMLLTIHLKNALDSAYKYAAELANIEFSEEDVLRRLDPKQRGMLKYTDGKRRMVTEEVDKTLVAFKLGTAKFIKELEHNADHFASAKPEVELRMENLQRADRGQKPLKRLPKKAVAEPA